MFSLDYYDLHKLVEKGVNVCIYSCGEEFKLFIGDGDMLYYKHQFDSIVYKLKLNDNHQITIRFINRKRKVTYRLS